MLMVGTTGGMLEFNARTLDMCSYVDFQGMYLLYFCSYLPYTKHIMSIEYSNEKINCLQIKSL